MKIYKVMIYFGVMELDGPYYFDLENEAHDFLHEKAPENDEEKESYFANSQLEEIYINGDTLDYFEAALWSSPDYSENDAEFLDKNFSISDINLACIVKAQNEISDFEEKAEKKGIDLDDIDNIGHDFWLTRNGHGAGFWDRNYPGEMGDILTELSEQYGNIDPVIGDDGKIYFE